MSSLTKLSKSPSGTTRGGYARRMIVSRVIILLSRDYKFLALGEGCSFSLVAIVDETNTLFTAGDYVEPRDESLSLTSLSPRTPLTNPQTNTTLYHHRGDANRPSLSQQGLNAAGLLAEIGSNQGITTPRWRNTRSRTTTKYQGSALSSPVPIATTYTANLSEETLPGLRIPGDVGGGRRIRSDAVTLIWPLESKSEALLLRHYTQNLAIWVSPAGAPITTSLPSYLVFHNTNTSVH
jgi:hypothetical protein